MMLIKEESIIKAVEKLNTLSENELEEISEHYVSEQELLISYLLSAGIEFKNEELLPLIIYYFNVFFEAAFIQGIKFNEIDDEFISKFEDDFFPLLDEYGEEEDEDLIVSFCNQPAMLDFFMYELHGEDDAGNVLSDTTKSNLFIVGIALISMMDRAMINLTVVK